MEDFGDIKQADNIAFLITNRLMSTLASHICKKKPDGSIPSAGSDAGP
jgi:hypothetical protein